MEPRRKQLRLREYDYNTPGAYFVTLCTKDKACILSTIVGADAHIGPYPKLTKNGMVVEKYLRNIPGIGKYVIMPNHIHMILHVSAEDILHGPMWASAPTGAEGVPQGPMWASAPTRVSIPQLIKSFKIVVTKELGQSIWQRSYYDHIIRDERDYLVRVQYIDENPAKWYFDDYYVP